ncbi:hypothetical protein [Nonomuraea sp. NPDC002799]
MDVQAEILQLKLRVEDLEAHAHAGRPGEDRELLREIGERTQRVEAAVAELNAGLANARTEVIEQFGALETEVAAVRRAVSLPSPRPVAERPATADDLAAVRSEVAEEIRSLRSELLDLGIKLDRLLKAEGA